MAKARGAQASSGGSDGGAPHVAPRRAPTGGGYARGQESRDRIIEAAIGLFGEAGLDGTSTRVIAERAGGALPLIQYYFGGKEGLYLACAGHIATRIEGGMVPAIASVHALLGSGEAEPDELRRHLHAALGGFCEMVLGSGVPQGWVPFIVREQANPGPAFEILYDRIMRRVLEALAGLVAALARRDGRDPEVRATVLELVGHVLVFRTARAAALRAMDWSTIDGPRIERIKSGLHAHADRALAALGQPARGHAQRRRGPTLAGGDGG